MSVRHQLAIVALVWSVAPLCLAGDSLPLPDPFLMKDGSRVVTMEDWAARREEMRAVLEAVEYGHAPPLPVVEVVEESREDLVLQSGLVAEKVLVKLRFANVTVQAGYWKPKAAAGPLPTILADEPVWWEQPFVANGIVDRVLTRGYVFAGFWNDDFACYEDPEKNPVQAAYPDYDWGTVAVAAWGYRVVMNWLETVDPVDVKQVAIWGHSRRGKACAWAGATDERFAAVIPHMSGMGGTAAYRVRSKGAQELEGLLERYWLHPAIYAFIDREESLPFDQHFLHALIAPRPVYAHVGLEDAWGNPRGEQAAWEAGRAVYRWLDAADACGIYFGNYGHHDPNGPEGGDTWETALQFLDWQFKGVPPEKSFLKPNWTGPPSHPVAKGGET